MLPTLAGMVCLGQMHPLGHWLSLEAGQGGVICFNQNEGKCFGVHNKKHNISAQLQYMCTTKNEHINSFASLSTAPIPVFPLLLPHFTKKDLCRPCPATKWICGTMPSQP